MATIIAGVGFTLAVEDGWQLAKSLATHGLCEEALKEYEALRQGRVRSAIVMATAQVGAWHRV